VDFGDALGIVAVDRGYKEAERPECGTHVEVVRVSRGVGVQESFQHNFPGWTCPATPALLPCW